MYSSTRARVGVMPTTGMGALGISLKPPAWARNIFGAIFKGTTITVPTPLGPQTFDLGNPADVAALKSMVTQSKVRVSTPGQQPTGPIDQVNKTVQENIPGGWLTVIGVAAGIVFLMRRR
jgi:hypothetical protein